VQRTTPRLQPPPQARSRTPTPVDGASRHCQEAPRARTRAIAALAAGRRKPAVWRRTPDAHSHPLHRGCTTSPDVRHRECSEDTLTLHLAEVYACPSPRPQHPGLTLETRSRLPSSSPTAASRDARLPLVHRPSRGPVPTKVTRLSRSITCAIATGSDRTGAYEHLRLHGAPGDPGERRRPSHDHNVARARHRRGVPGSLRREALRYSTSLGQRLWRRARGPDFHRSGPLRGRWRRSAGRGGLLWGTRGAR
jgi:hypothetical protein